MLDIQTLLIVNLIVNLISLAVTIIIWGQYGRRFAGISFWIVYMAFQVAGIALDILPGFMSEVVIAALSNTLILAGALFMLIGLERFTGKSSSQIHNFVLLAVFVPVFTYFAIQGNMTMRSVTVASMIIVIEAQACWLLLKRVPAKLRSMTYLVGLVMSGYVVVSFIRILLLLAYPIETNDFFKTGPASAIAITAYLSLHICLVIALALMVTRRLHTDVLEEEEKFAKAFHSAPYAILITRASDGKILEVNDGFIQITGHSRQSAVGKTTLALHLWEKEEEYLAILNELAVHNRIKDREIHILKQSGEVINGLLSADVLLINGEQCIISSLSDITEQSQLRQKLQEMATHDVLTGLPNRRLFYDRFELALANAQRGPKKMALLSIDIDRFKTINDTLGHAVGDQVLVQAARRLTECARKIDITARFGGDEFVLLLWEVDLQENALEVAQRILESFRQPFLVEDRPLQLSASIGIALYPGHGQDIQMLLEQSDKALYRAKMLGRDNYQFA